MILMIFQYSLGLYDCDEKKTQDVIRLLKNLSEKYVPQLDGQIIEEVFFGGTFINNPRRKERFKRGYCFGVQNHILRGIDQISFKLGQIVPNDDTLYLAKFKKKVAKTRSNLRKIFVTHYWQYIWSYMYLHET